MNAMLSIDTPPKAKALSGRSRRHDAVKPVKCQICGSEIEPGLDLTMQPVGDLILTRSQLNRPETFYPMQMHHCGNCGLAFTIRKSTISIRPAGPPPGGAAVA